VSECCCAAPIQLLTIGVDEARVPDAVLEEFVRLQEAGLAAS
jgi:hypothetical protein